jgi:hypothetical protein
MEGVLTREKIILFVVFVFPGLVSMHIYRLIMPARGIKSSAAFLEAAFYSILNFVIFLPILAPVAYKGFAVRPDWRVYLEAASILIVGPVLWPALFVITIRSRKLMRHLQLPYPTAWDAFFDRRNPCFLLVHLKDGGVIGGYFGFDSFAGAFPHEGDLYIEAVYSLDEDGHFAGPVEDTQGLLLRRDDYTYIELFNRRA